MLTKARAKILKNCLRCVLKKISIMNSPRRPLFSEIVYLCIYASLVNSFLDLQNNRSQKIYMYAWTKTRTILELARNFEVWTKYLKQIFNFQVWNIFTAAQSLKKISIFPLYIYILAIISHQKIRLNENLFLILSSRRLRPLERKLIDLKFTQYIPMMVSDIVYKWKSDQTSMTSYVAMTSIIEIGDMKFSVVELEVIANKRSPRFLWLSSPIMNYEVLILPTGQKCIFTYKNMFLMTIWSNKSVTFNSIKNCKVTVCSDYI